MLFTWYMSHIWCVTHKLQVPVLRVTVILCRKKKCSTSCTNVCVYFHFFVWSWLCPGFNFVMHERICSNVLCTAPSCVPQKSRSQRLFLFPVLMTYFNLSYSFSWVLIDLSIYFQMIATARFTCILLAYALFRISHWWVIAVSIFSFLCSFFVLFFFRENNNLAGFFSHFIITKSSPLAQFSLLV